MVLRGGRGRLSWSQPSGKGKGEREMETRGWQRGLVGSQSLLSMVWWWETGQHRWTGGGRFINRQQQNCPGHQVQSYPTVGWIPICVMPGSIASVGPPGQYLECLGTYL